MSSRIEYWPVHVFVHKALTDLVAIRAGTVNNNGHCLQRPPRFNQRPDHSSN